MNGSWNNCLLVMATALRADAAQLRACANEADRAGDMRGHGRYVALAEAQEARALDKERHAARLAT